MKERINEADFREKSEQAILEIERSFGELAEQRDIDVEVEGGVLTVTFEEGEPGKFILSPNSSVRQIWLSARMSSFKFDWSEASGAFILSGSDQSLKQVITRLTREQLGDDAVEM
ncbi:MAG TPA: iron donor protein CyaY [Blastocatellia bacterium]|nr:iron donor protein CyaY [Blastocatellia bacterium]